MAEVALTASSIARTGVEMDLVAANSTSGQEFSNDGRTMLVVKNFGGDTVSVNVEYQASLDGGLVTPGNLDAAVGDGETRLFGPFPAELYNDSDGNVEIDYTGVVTSVSVGAFRL